MLTVLRDPRMWVAAAVAAIATTLGSAFLLGLFARGLGVEATEQAVKGAPAPIELPLLRHIEEPVAPIPAVVVAGGFAVVFFGAAGVASFVVLGRSSTEEPGEPT